jgi:hypothetical protein
MLYFEKQEPKSSICVLCALNNVLQEEQYRTSAKELDLVALRLAVIEQSNDVLHVKNSRNNRSVHDFYSHLCKKGLEGGWSIRVARQYLIEKKIAFEWDVPISNFKKDQLVGHYFIRTKVGKSMHAIAIVDGMLLDSLRSEPEPWTGDPRYEILLVCRVLV